jgi:hypothetical protein
MTYGIKVDSHNHKSCSCFDSEKSHVYDEYEDSAATDLSHLRQNHTILKPAFDQLNRDTQAKIASQFAAQMKTKSDSFSATKLASSMKFVDQLLYRVKLRARLNAIERVIGLEEKATKSRKAQKYLWDELVNKHAIRNIHGLSRGKEDQLRRLKNKFDAHSQIIRENMTLAKKCRDDAGMPDGGGFENVLDV